ncbi:hypothetical protein LPC08_24465 (plasmid) [Roseomonas sp. OT10]|uniref:XF1762 family protein n=1 Tax=Roseomonas cutis TaxID=2897332 RepID=UPI001E48DEA7|nr:XF1762 family protein [Roseomonas sp. OT10]UFN51677.1 hypothetical protein LPC08_24465 [Roseomonas sp. OT10]
MTGTHLSYAAEVLAIRSPEGGATAGPGDNDRRHAEAGRVPPRCPWCGEPAMLELTEVWSDHAFLLDACCPAAHEEACAGMADDPAWARALLRRLGAEDLLGHGLRRVADTGCGQLLLDRNLAIQPIRFAAAADFVRRHHVHNPAPVAWRFGAAIANGLTLLGVVMVGNPVARALMGRGIVEVNRLCVRRDVPRALAWNACSQLYGWAAREAEARGFSRIITYTRQDEQGHSLIAAGWEREARVRGRSWNSSCRARTDHGTPIDRFRWSRPLRPRRAAPRPIRPAPMTALTLEPA